MPSFQKEIIVVTGVLDLVITAQNVAVAMGVYGITALTPGINQRPDNGVMSFMVGVHGYPVDSEDATQEEKKRREYIRWLSMSATVQWVHLRLGEDDQETKIIEAFDIPLEFKSGEHSLLWGGINTNPHIQPQTSIDFAAVVEVTDIEAWLADQGVTIVNHYSANNKNDAYKKLGGDLPYRKHLFIAANLSDRKFIEANQHCPIWTVTDCIVDASDRPSRLYLLAGYEDTGIGWLIGSKELRFSPPRQKFVIRYD